MKKQGVIIDGGFARINHRRGPYPILEYKSLNASVIEGWV